MRALTIITAWLAASAAASAQVFQFTQIDVPFPGARLTRPFGVNASGQIVGVFQDSSGATHGFLRNTDDTYSVIDFPDAISTNASGIDARGDIVGRYTTPDRINHPYVRTSQGVYRGFELPAPCVAGTSPTVAHGVNDEGDITGRCFDASGKELGWLWRHDGTFTILDRPTSATTDAWIASDPGLVGGDYSDDDGSVHGYLWTEALGFVTLDVPGHQTGVRDINERGDVTGVYGPADGRFHGFLLRDGAFTQVDYPGSRNNPPLGGTLVVNDNGLMVGGFVDAAGVEHGFMAISCPSGGCR